MKIKDRRGRWFAAPAALAVLGVALPASASAGAQGGKDSDWPSVNGTLDGQRYSPLTQIDATNVNGLKVAWRFRLSDGAWADYPNGKVKIACYAVRLEGDDVQVQVPPPENKP